MTFSNEQDCQNAKTLPKIHEASEKVGKAFSKLGYAHCVFQNCCKAKFLAIFQVLSKKDYPKSYRNLFIYFTGHGHTNHISTRDGYIAINSLKQLLSLKVLEEMAKILIFDCCRVNANVPLQDSTKKCANKYNLKTIYMTPNEGQTWRESGEAMGVGTIQLVKFLEVKESCGLDDFLRQLSASMKNAARNVRPDLEMFIDLDDGHIVKPINFYKDKREPSKLEEEIV